MIVVATTGRSGTIALPAAGRPVSSPGCSALLGVSGMGWQWGATMEAGKKLISAKITYLTILNHGWRVTLLYELTS